VSGFEPLTLLAANVSGITTQERILRFPPSPEEEEEELFVSIGYCRGTQAPAVKLTARARHSPVTNIHARESVRNLERESARARGERDLLSGKESNSIITGAPLRRRGIRV